MGAILGLKALDVLRLLQVTLGCQTLQDVPLKSSIGYWSRWDVCSRTLLLAGLPSLRCLFHELNLCGPVYATSHARDPGSASLGSATSCPRAHIHMQRQPEQPQPTSNDQNPTSNNQQPHHHDNNNNNSNDNNCNCNYNRNDHNDNNHEHKSQHHTTTTTTTITTTTTTTTRIIISSSSSSNIPLLTILV